MGSQAPVLRALADLNRAALGQESWDTGLKGLSNALRVEATSFEEYSADGSARAFGYTSFDDAMARDYLAHYHRVNPRLNCVLAASPGDPLIDDFMVPSRSRGRSEFFDWYDKTSEFTYCMAVRLHKSPESWAAMAFHRPTPNVPFEPGTRELLQCIAPNLILIYQTAREIEAVRANEKVRSLDSFRTALAFLTIAGRVDAANAAFAGLIARTSALRVDKAGRIAGGSPSTQRMVEQALGQALAGWARAVTLHDDCVGRMYLHFLPQFSSIGEDAPPTTRVLLLVRGDFARPELARELQQLFDLTEREAQIAQGLAQARPLERIALELGMSLATAKVHLRNMFEKTGAHRQAELVALLVSATAP